MSAPGCEQSENPRFGPFNSRVNPERVHLERNPFRLPTPCGLNDLHQIARHYISIMNESLLRANCIKKITPKAFANVSPGFEQSENPGFGPFNSRVNPERVRLERNPFRVPTPCGLNDPRVVAALQLWADISERLRRSETSDVCERLRRSETSDVCERLRRSETSAVCERLRRSETSAV